MARQLEILSLVAVDRIEEAKEKFAVFARDYPAIANITGFRRPSFSTFRHIEKIVDAFRLAGLSD